jgi:hypothetical protein
MIPRSNLVFEACAQELNLSGEKDFALRFKRSQSMTWGKCFQYATPQEL